MIDQGVKILGFESFELFICAVAYESSPWQFGKEWEDNIKETEHYL